METSKIKYLGELRTESIHVKSSSTILTDAPVDNHGKGEAFSPTDLLATSLGNCMMTVMGIAAQTHKITYKDISCKVTKIMDSSPRRVKEIVVDFDMGKHSFTAKRKINISEYSKDLSRFVKPSSGLGADRQFSIRR